MNIKPSTIYGEWLKEEIIKETFKNIKRIVSSDKKHNDNPIIEQILLLEKVLLDVG